MISVIRSFDGLTQSFSGSIPLTVSRNFVFLTSTRLSNAITASNCNMDVKIKSFVQFDLNYIISIHRKRNIKKKFDLLTKKTLTLESLQNIHVKYIYIYIILYIYVCQLHTFFLAHSDMVDILIIANVLTK
jgi:hypothetical protein